MKKILVVGQTPPPYNGQFIMIQKMLAGDYQELRLYHIRMSFSKENDQIGKFSFSKVWHLIRVIGKIYYFRFRFRISCLYYPPSGPNKIPFFRDLVILLSTKFLFSKIIFHFHAGGISEFYKQLNPLLKFLYRLAYFKAEVGIRLSPYSPEDVKFLKIKKEFIVPNGIDDDFAALSLSEKQRNNEIPKILFVGILCETKGEIILLDACKILKEKGIPFRLSLMGKFESTKYEQQIKDRIQNLGLNENIDLLGVLSGKEKFIIFSQSDIFCFPSFYESENFPVVLIEAFQFSMPVVTTLWRGIPALVDDTETGFLTPIKNPEAIAEKLELLLSKPELRKEMGTKAREKYLKEYTIQKFYENLEKAFLSPFKA